MMAAKESLTLALRVMGFWVLISAVAAMAGFVAGLGSFGADPQSQRFLISSGFTVLGYAALAAFLLLFAPTIASWFYGKASPSDPAARQPALKPGDIYTISAHLLGIYSLLHAVGPMGGLVNNLLESRAGQGFSGEFTRAYLVQVVSYLACGAVLILWSEKIAKLFSRSHHEPEAKGE
jgi:hypothetical protein